MFILDVSIVFFDGSCHHLLCGAQFFPEGTLQIHISLINGLIPMQITPVYDPEDVKTGKRLNSELVNTLTDDGRINRTGGKVWEGIKRFEARVTIEKSLTETHGKQ